MALNFPEGAWQTLLGKAYQLLDAVSVNCELPSWSLGGGTVLMFHYNHRLSKDIDIFVPDPQFLGYINPQLSDEAESLTNDYVEGAGYVKLVFDEGEIDFVASDTLTDNPFETDVVLGRDIRLETPVEIVAKKIFHRGDQATPRDLLDFALVIQNNHEEIIRNADVFLRNLDVFIRQLTERREVLKPVFESIDVLDFRLSYDECLNIVCGIQADLALNSQCKKPSI